MYFRKNGEYGCNVKIISIRHIYKLSCVYFVSGGPITQSLTITIYQIAIETNVYIIL
jgi:hypothetical protein